MKDVIKSAVEDIFKNYEDTPQLKDFREEITMNLIERVSDLIKKGASENEATNKALMELGDITEIADSIGQQKRKEAISDYYFQKKPLDKIHAIGFSLAGIILIFGLIASVLIGYKDGNIGTTIWVFMPFGLVSVCAFVFFGLTHETHVHYSMSAKRSILYSVASGLIFIGVTLGASLLFKGIYFSKVFYSKSWIEWVNRVSVTPALVALLIFTLPGIAMLVYLLLTQENRLKPWFLEQYYKTSNYADKYGEKFGMLSGFIWTFAIALFVLLGFLIGWHPAWITFLFAVAAEMLALFFMTEK